MRHHRVLLLLAASALAARPAVSQAGPASANLLRATADLPVFTPVNTGGNLLISTPPGGRPTVGLFLRRGLAESFVAGVRAQNASLAGQLKVDAPLLGDLLRQRPGGSSYELGFIPDPDEVAAATQELRSQGRPPQSGTPVFLLRSPAAGYVTITVNGRSVIPGFLGYAEVLALRAQAQAAVGTPAALLIEVASLENLLAALESSPDPFYANLLLQPAGAAAAEAGR